MFYALDIAICIYTIPQNLRYGTMSKLSNQCFPLLHTQAISADSKTRQFLLQGSGTTYRTTSSMPKLAHASFPSDSGVPRRKHGADDVLIEKDARSYSEEVLLKPNYLAANSPGAPTIRRHVFKVASNRIVPVNLRKSE